VSFILGKCSELEPVGAAPALRTEHQARTQGPCADASAARATRVSGGVEIRNSVGNRRLAPRPLEAGIENSAHRPGRREVAQDADGGL
jgi:hypothetical protein